MHIRRGMWCGDDLEQTLISSDHTQLRPRTRVLSWPCQLPLVCSACHQKRPIYIQKRLQMNHRNLYTYKKRPMYMCRHLCTRTHTHTHSLVPEEDCSTYIHIYLHTYMHT